MTFTFAFTRNGSSITSVVGSSITSIYGRREPTVACSPRTLSFSVVYTSSTVGTQDPNTWLLGDRIVCTVTNTSYAARTYFSGTITDLTVRHNVMEVVATSDGLSGINRTPVTIGAQTSVNTGTVVAAALAAIQADGALPGKTIVTDPGTSIVTTPAVIDAVSSTFLGQVITSEPSGVLLEDEGNGIRYSDYDARRISTMPATQKFDFSSLGASILYDWELERTVSDFLNYADVVYNTGTATFSDSASITANGTYAKTFQTYLVDPIDATYLATRAVAHGLTPGFRTSGITIDVGGLSDANRENVTRYMRTGSYIKLPTFLTGAQTEYFVEGWQDTFTYSATGAKQWFRLLYLSDIVNTAAAQRYVDVTSGVTYATVNPTYRYIDLEGKNI